MNLYIYINKNTSSSETQKQHKHMRNYNQEKDAYIQPECKVISIDVKEMILQTSNPSSEDGLDGQYL